MPASVVVGLGLLVVIQMSPSVASLVARVESQEHQPGGDAGGQLDDEVDPDRRPGEQSGGGATERDGRVEHAAGDAADGEGARGDGEADRQAEEPVVRLVPAGGDV